MPGARPALSAIGNSYGFVIEKPILELLKFDTEAEYEVSTDGERLIIERAQGARRKRFDEAAQRIMKKHASAFRKLAK